MKYLLPLTLQALSGVIGFFGLVSLSLIFKEYLLIYLVVLALSWLFHSGPLLVGSNSLTQDPNLGPCIDLSHWTYHQKFLLTFIIECWVN